MSILEISAIAIALSLDAFGVSLSIGLDNQIKRKNKFYFALSFGFFQFLFSFIGALVGVFFSKYIATVPSLVGGIIMAIVGILMIKEGLSKKEECILLKPGMYFVLGISVSIDALVIGFTVINRINGYLNIGINTLFIGIVTFVISVFGFYLSRVLKKISLVEKFADFIGGIMLILLGINMMLS